MLGRPYGHKKIGFSYISKYTVIILKSLLAQHALATCLYTGEIKHNSGDQRY